MSRIGNLPITVPKGVDVTVASGQISVKGPLGTLSQRLSTAVDVKRDGDDIVFKALDESIHSNAMSGTLRALVANMVQGAYLGILHCSCSWSWRAMRRIINAGEKKPAVCAAGWMGTGRNLRRSTDRYAPGQVAHLDFAD
jgi:hypothetical protein